MSKYAAGNFQTTNINITYKRTSKGGNKFFCLKWEMWPH